MKNYYTVLIFVISYKIHKNLVTEKALWFAIILDHPKKMLKLKGCRETKFFPLKRKK